MWDSFNEKRLMQSLISISFMISAGIFVYISKTEGLFPAIAFVGFGIYFGLLALNKIATNHFIYCGILGYLGIVLVLQFGLSMPLVQVIAIMFTSLLLLHYLCTK